MDISSLQFFVPFWQLVARRSFDSSFSIACYLNGIEYMVFLKIKYVSVGIFAFKTYIHLPNTLTTEFLKITLSPFRVRGKAK